MVTDVSSVPDEPPAGIIYRHKVRFIDSIRTLWAHREIIYTLAERDFRAQYKQATLGVMWAVLSPVAMLVILVIVFSKVKSLVIPGVPYPLYSFVGILCWGFFAAALGTGGSSLLTNKALLAKTQFPRECFPLETMLVGGLNTVISWIPLTILFILFGRAPAVTTVWVPALHGHRGGVRRRGHPGHLEHHHPDARPAPGAPADHLARAVRHSGDLALLEDPDVVPRRRRAPRDRVLVNGHVVTAAHWVGGFNINLQIVYGFFNPLGPIIDNARRTLLLGLSPEWSLVGMAALGAVLYLLIGYRIFKRLEVNFADIA